MGQSLYEFEIDPVKWRAAAAGALTVAAAAIEAGDDKTAAELLADVLGAVKFFNPRADLVGIHRNTRNGFMVIGCYPFHPGPASLPASPAKFQGGRRVDRREWECPDCGENMWPERGQWICRKCGGVKPDDKG